MMIGDKKDLASMTAALAMLSHIPPISHYDNSYNEPKKNPDSNKRANVKAARKQRKKNK